MPSALLLFNLQILTTIIFRTLRGFGRFLSPHLLSALLRPSFLFALGASGLFPSTIAASFCLVLFSFLAICTGPLLGAGAICLIGHSSCAGRGYFRHIQPPWENHIILDHWTI